MVFVHEKAHAIAVEAYGSWHGAQIDLAGMRAGFDRMMPEPVGDVTVTEAKVGGVAGRWVTVPESGATTVLHLHGGGGMLGSSFAYRDFASRIARSCQARVFLPDYGLAPENPFPAGFEDAHAVYRGLLEDDGVDPANLVVAGDSAGGGLAVALVAALNGTSLPRPACVVTMSPFVDLTLSGRSMAELTEFDPLVTQEAAAQMSAAYLAGHDGTDPRVSPIFADFTGFPPLLVQVGGCELLLDDAVRLTEAVTRAGGKAELQIGEGLVHVYQMFADKLPEAAQAIDAVGAFIRGRGR